MNLLSTFFNAKNISIEPQDNNKNYRIIVSGETSNKRLNIENAVLIFDFSNLNSKTLK